MHVGFLQTHGKKETVEQVSPNIPTALYTLHTLVFAIQHVWPILTATKTLIHTVLHVKVNTHQFCYMLF